MFDKIIGEELRKRREEKRYSIREMAEVIGCVKATYSYYERGITSMSLDDFIKACDFLGINWVKLAKTTSEKCREELNNAD